MKKFLKLTTVVVSMVMALTFVSCAHGNDDGQLNLVGTYGISKVEYLYKTSSDEVAFTRIMPTSTSLRYYGTLKSINGDTTSVDEFDFTITKTSNGYSFNWAKYNVDGVAQDADAKAEVEAIFADASWNDMTAEFAMTLTTTADGKWSDNSEPASSGTYTVDEANSKVTITTLIGGGETLKEPEIREATYSDNGKTLVVVQDFSSAEETNKTTMTFVSCANGNTSNNGNENSNDGQLNLVGTYGLSKIEQLYNDSCWTETMPTSTSLRDYGTLKFIDGDTTRVVEVDVTITNTSDGYSFNWVKYNVDGVAQGEDEKAVMEAKFNGEDWNYMTAGFAMTLTTTAEGTWSDNNTPASSGTYTVDEANSKVTIKTLIGEGETLKEPEIREATYSDNGKTLVVVQDRAEGTGKTILTFTRK